MTETDCLFCKFVSGELQTDVVLETDSVLAFRDISAWLGKGKPHHPVAKIFPLSKTADAHAYLQSGKANGNVIIAVDK